jgi:hypothetical protein
VVPSMRVGGVGRARPSLSGNRSVTGQLGSVTEDVEIVCFSVVGGGRDSQGRLPCESKAAAGRTQLQVTGL